MAETRGQHSANDSESNSKLGSEGSGAAAVPEKAETETDSQTAWQLVLKTVIQLPNSLHTVGSVDITLSRWR